MNTQLSRSILPALTIAAVVSGVYVHGYVDSGRRWSTSTVHYYVNPQSIHLSPSVAVNAVQMAAGVWNDAGAGIELVYAGTTSGSSLTMNYKNEMFFRDGENGGYAAETYSWWDGSNKYKDSDIVFYEGAYTYFSQSGCSRGVYAESIATHEFGHLLGLKHTTVSGATMQASTGYCDQNWLTLADDDISGIRALYPPGTGSAGTNSAPSVSITAPSNGASYAEGTTITFSGSAQDSEDGSLTAKMAWSSNLSGQIGTGGSVTKALSAGTHTITARVTDAGGLTASKQISVTVAASTAAAPSEPAPSSGAQLSANAYKVKGQQKVDLSWSGLSASSVDVFRSGGRISTTPNSGKMTDNIDRKGGGSYSYKVCAAGTTTCSNQVSVTF